MTKLQARYLRLTAKELIDQPGERHAARLKNLCDEVWEEMDEPEKEQTNTLVRAIFGKWL